MKTSIHWVHSGVIPAVSVGSLWPYFWEFHRKRNFRETKIILWLLHCDQHQNDPPALQTVTGQSIVSQWMQPGSCSYLLPRAQKHELLQRGLFQAESTKPLLCTSFLMISCWHGRPSLTLTRNPGTGAAGKPVCPPVLPCTHQHGRQPLPALSLSQLASSFLENKPLLIWEKIFILCLLAYSRAHRERRMDAKSSLDSFRRVSQTDGTAWHDSHHVLGLLIPARAQGYAGALHSLHHSWHHLLTSDKN